MLRAFEKKNNCSQFFKHLIWMSGYLNGVCFIVLPWRQVAAGSRPARPRVDWCATRKFFDVHWQLSVAMAMGSRCFSTFQNISCHFHWRAHSGDACSVTTSDICSRLLQLPGNLRMLLSIMFIVYCSLWNSEQCLGLLWFNAQTLQ